MLLLIRARLIMMRVILGLLIEAQRVRIRVVIIHGLAELLRAVHVVDHGGLGDPVGDLRESHLLSIHRLLHQRAPVVFRSAQLL